MAISALPTPPSRSDPGTFAARGDAFLGALPTFQSEANALATEVNGYATSAGSSASSASSSAGTATAAANTATTQAGIATTQASNALTSANNAAASAASITAQVSTATHAATSKSTPVDADELPLADSAATFGLKKLTWANLKATLASWINGGTIPASFTSITGPHNGTVGATTPAAGSFTTLSASGGGTISNASTDAVLKIDRTSTSAGSGWLGSNTTYSHVFSNGALTNIGQLKITQDAAASTVTINSTGIAVTGALSASGNIQSNGKAYIAPDGTFKWGSTGTHGNLTWDTNKAIVAAGAGNALVLGTDSGSATLDTSGNLGLGVTPNAWVTNSKAIQLATVAAFAQDTNGGTNVLNNAFESAAGVFTYRQTSSAARYYQLLNAHYWYTAPSGTAGNTISFTQAMTLDASGNLSNTGSHTIGSFTTATKPAHAAGKMIYVSDGGAGAVFQGSNGSSWVNLG